MNKFILLVIFCSILGAVGQYYFKVGVEPFTLKKLVFGAILYGLAMILYILSLKYLELNIAYPIIALSYVWVMLISWQYLGESINIQKFLGSIGIVLSVGLIYYG